MSGRRNRGKTGKRKPDGRGKAPGSKRTRFVKGKSGNPKGRPPLPADYRTAIDQLGPEALQALANIVHNPRHPRHDKVCEYVTNRWKGTPTVKTEVAGPGGGPIPVKAVRTSDEKRKRVEAILATAAARVKAVAGEGDPDAAASAD